MHRKVTLNKGFLSGSAVSNLPAVHETPEMQVQFHKLGRSHGVGNGNPPQCFEWKIPWREEPGGLYSPWSLIDSDQTKQLNTCVSSQKSDDLFSKFYSVNEIFT